MRPNRRAAFTLVELLVVIACVVAVLWFVMPPALPSHPGRASRIQCVNNLKNLGFAYRIDAKDNADRYPWERLATNRPAYVPTNYAPLPGVRLAPDQGVAAQFAHLSNQLSSVQLLICPSDARRFVLKTNSFACLMDPVQTVVRDRAISYFLGTSVSEDLPQSILGGDRNLAGGPFGADSTSPPLQVALRIPHSVATNQWGLKSAVWTEKVHNTAGNLLLGDGSVQQVTLIRMRDQLRDAAVESGSDLDFLFPAN